VLLLIKFKGLLTNLAGFLLHVQLWYMSYLDGIFDTLYTSNPQPETCVQIKHQLYFQNDIFYHWQHYFDMKGILY